jgi:Na+/H+-dicarboxylate symporter
MKLWHKVVIGLFAGILFGILSGEIGLLLNMLAGKIGYNITIIGKDVVEFVKPIGTIFINMIKMVVVPLIFFSLISGITSMSDSKSLGRIGIKACIAFVSTTAFAIVIGLISATIARPGEGVVLNLPTTAAAAGSAAPKEASILQILLDIVPVNAIGAMAEGHILQVVFFAIFTGITLNSMGMQGKKLIEFCQLMAKLVFKMIGIIIQLSPYGVFALMAWVVGTQGLDILLSLMKLIGVVVFACVLQYLIFGMLIAVFGKMSPMPFFKKSLEYQALAFATSSSKATLATTMEVCQNKLGISKSSTSFVLPLGASINMDGTAIYLGICAIFFAQATGTVLLPHDYFMIILTATLGSIGAAGIPGGSLIMMSMVLSAVHLPLEGIALIAGIDRILDMLRTTVNITGDATITLIVDKTEKTLNEEMYYSKGDALINASEANLT